MSTYLFLDVSRKQEFIYQSNKLRDNLYRSFLIKAATEKMENYVRKENETALTAFLDKKYKDKYEFVYSGGGNSILSFKDKNETIKFMKTYSFAILKDYPEMELYISMADDDEESIKDRSEMGLRSLLIQRCDKLKDSRRSRFKRWSYGIEKIGESGKPVEYREKSKKDNDEDKEDKERNRIVTEYVFNEFWHNEELMSKVKPTDKLEDYKEDQEEKSYIGVIAIDGNRMGEMVNKITNFCELRAFSETIETVYSLAVEESLKEYVKELNKEMLLTPVLKAGDDICFITHAKHALPLANLILKNIKKISRQAEYKKNLNFQNDKESLSACGGVAIARNNYPFFELVKRAEGLCHHAKEKQYEFAGAESAPDSFLDWEVVKGQVEKEYEYEEYVKNGARKELYHVKPLCIGDKGEFKKDILYYEDFMDLAVKIKEGIQEEKISSGILNDIKKLIYTGQEPYNLYFKTDDENIKNLQNIIDEYYRGSSNGIYIKSDGSFIYLLNDLIELMAFIEGGVKHE